MHRCAELKVAEDIFIEHGGLWLVFRDGPTQDPQPVRGFIGREPAEEFVQKCRHWATWAAGRTLTREWLDANPCPDNTAGFRPGVSTEVAWLTRWTAAEIPLNSGGEGIYILQGATDA